MATEATTETVAVATEPRPLESLSPKQLHEWKMTGEIPTEEPATQDPPAAKTTEKNAEVQAKSATDTGTEAKQEPPVSKLGYGDLRKKLREAQAEIDRLKTAPQPAPVEVETEAPRPKKAAENARPRPTDRNEDGTPKYKDWDAYEDARDAYVKQEAIAEFEATQSKRQKEAAVDQQNKAIERSWSERVEKGREKYPDLDAVLDPKTGPAADIAPGSVIDQWILDSPVAVDMLCHFDKNRSELKRIGALHPIAAARELTKLESKLSGEPAKAPPAEQIRTTKAPPPAREVGGRGTTATDEVSKAVADDDVRAYILAANRAQIAGKKR